MQSLLSLFYVKAKTSDIYIFLRTTQLPHKDFAPLSAAAIPSHFVKVCFHEKKIVLVFKLQLFQYLWYFFVGES